jgi:Na+-driven multidrug efflux pump
VGQNLGAKKHDRVKKAVAFGFVCCVTLAELVGVAMYLLAPKLIAIFNDNPEVVTYGTRHLRTICLFFGLLAFSHCAAGTLRGAGKATIPMLTMLSCWCVLRVTYITLAVPLFNALETVSRAYPITWACSTIVFTIYLLKGNWIHNFDRDDR